MRPGVCCPTARRRVGLPWLAFASVILAGLAPTYPQTATQPTEQGLALRETWEQTLKTAYPNWERNPQPSLWLMRKMAGYFPGETGKLADMALAIARAYRSTDVERFEAVEFALSLNPPEKEQAYLKLELARLQGAYVSPSMALRTIRGLESSPLFDEPTRKLVQQSIEGWRYYQIDILALGRNYEAERLLQEADEMVRRQEYREAACRLIRVAVKHPDGYLPQEGDVIVSPGAHCRELLVRLAAEHPKEVAEAAELENPGLARRAESRDRSAMELLANVFGFTPAGWQALVMLSEEDLDAGRPRLAVLRLRRALDHSQDERSKSDALWRLALAGKLAGDVPTWGAAVVELERLGDSPVTAGAMTMPARQARAMLQREFPAADAPASQPDLPPAGQTLRPRVTFSYQPALFDLKNRTAFWPRFWARPETLATIDGDRAFFHDSANMWAVDYRAGRLLWHYRSPGWLYELPHRLRSFSNQIDEAPQTSRGYAVALSGQVVCARFRRPNAHLLFELRALRAADGAVLWTTQGNAELAGLSYASDPVAAHDRFYVMAFANTHISTAWIVCLDPITGQVLWKTPVGSDVDSYKSGLGNFFSAHGGLTVRGDKVYAATDRGSFVALDSLDGSMRWASGCDRIFERHTYWGLNTHTTRADEITMTERSHSAPVVGPNAVFFLSKDHPGMFALEAGRGRRLFVALPRTAVEVLGEHDGLVIAAGREGLFALRTATGRGFLAWEHPLPLPKRMPWRSGFMRDGRVYWPRGNDILILSAADGGLLGRWQVDTAEPVSSIRPLPNGELAAFSSAGQIDRFLVLSPGKPPSQAPVNLVEDAPDWATHTDCLAARTGEGKRTALPAASVPCPAPLPPVQLLWRARFNHEELFTGAYAVQVVQAASRQRLLVAAGSQLRYYTLDTIGDMLWAAPTGPAPQQISPFRDSQVCVRWSHGFDVHDLETGRRAWGWSSANVAERDGIGAAVWGVCQGARTVAAWGRDCAMGLAPDGSALWKHAIVNNAWGVAITPTRWGFLLAVRQDADYGGRSYLVLLDEQTGRELWRHDLPKNTYCVSEGPAVWTHSRDHSTLAMVVAEAGGAREVWTRQVGPSQRVCYEPDRVYAVKPDKVLCLDRMTGRDASPVIPARGETFVPGPDAHTCTTPASYGRQNVRALDRDKGTERWRLDTGSGNPPRGTAQQVLVPGSAGTLDGAYHRSCVIRAFLGSICGVDIQTGQPMGRFIIPGRNLWAVDDGLGHLAIAQHDNLLVLRTELGPVVLGASSILPPAEVRQQLARLTAKGRSPADERRIETLRERLMWRHPPILACPRVDRPPHLDGEFDDWPEAKWAEIVGPADWLPADGGALSPSAKRWAGPEDCSARFAVRHDSKTLFLAVEVFDDDFSPPVGTDLATPGDSVEVGLSLNTAGVDAIQAGRERNHPDMKVVLAQVAGRPIANPVWFAAGSEVAISVRPGRVRYEAAIPFRSGRLFPKNPNQLRLAIQANDADRCQPKGAIRWAGGLGTTDASAQFGRLLLAPLSAGQMAEHRRIADLLPDAAIGWDLLRPVLESHLASGDLAAATEEVRGFVTRHPASYHASRCLAWHEHLLRVAADRSASDKTRQLARQINLPAIEQTQAQARIFARVSLPPGRRPEGLGLRFAFRGLRPGQRVVRGVYWGEDRGLLDEGLLYAGPLPDGDDIELSCPAELLELANKSVESVTFLNLGANCAWGDLGVADGAGTRTVWVPADGRPAGKNTNWAGQPAAPGRPGPAHGPEELAVVWTEHTFAPVLAAGLVDAHADLEARGGQLPRDKCLQAAWLIPENRLAYELLVALDDPEEVARFVRQFPASPLVPSLLFHLAGKPNRRALADQLVAEAKVPRQSARDFYNLLLPGIGAWQVVGPFSNEADVALRRTYEPEQQPDLDAVYRQGELELRWTAAQADPDGFVNLSRLLPADDYQAGYAMAWVRSPADARAWLFIESPNVLSVWVNDDRALENAVGETLGRRGGRLEPVPITLRTGWNRLLLKLCGRWGPLGFKIRLAGADGSPLADLVYAARPPPSTQPDNP